MIVGVVLAEMITVAAVAAGDQGTTIEIGTEIIEGRQVQDVAEKTEIESEEKITEIMIIDQEVDQVRLLKLCVYVIYSQLIFATFLENK